MNAPELKDNLQVKFSKKILHWEEKNPRRLYVEIEPEALREIAGYVFHELKARFAIASAVQTLAGFQILYHFSFDRSGVILSLRVRLGKKNPEIDSITEIIPAADWIEREIAELFGIAFRGASRSAAAVAERGLAGRGVPASEGLREGRKQVQGMNVQRSTSNIQRRMKKPRRGVRQ